MATYAISIKPYKPYAIPADAANAAAIQPHGWLSTLRRTTVRAGAGLLRLRQRLSTVAPWYDESEHGNHLVMWS